GEHPPDQVDQGQGAGEAGGDQQCVHAIPPAVGKTSPEGLYNWPGKAHQGGTPLSPRTRPPPSSKVPGNARRGLTGFSNGWTRARGWLPCALVPCFSSAIG